jgi:hypothetical protein
MAMTRANMGKQTSTGGFPDVTGDGKVTKKDIQKVVASKDSKQAKWYGQKAQPRAVSRYVGQEQPLKALWLAVLWGKL